MPVSIRWIRSTVLALATLWNLGWWIAPWLEARASPLAGWIYRFYSLICHQIEARSFYLGHEPLAVCSRCAAIYVGFWISVLALCLWNSRRPGLRWLYAVVGVMTLEVALELLGVRASTFESRTVIGMVAGAVVAPFIVEATEQTVLELWPAAAQDYAMPSSSKETT